MKKIYLTSRWARREEMKRHRDTLQAAGHRVTSRWLDECDGTAPADAARIDLDDILSSNLLLAFSEDPSVGYSTGGRHVELGYALCVGLEIIVIGPRENVFFHLPEIDVVDSLDEAMKLLAK